MLIAEIETASLLRSAACTTVRSSRVTARAWAGGQFNRIHWNKPLSLVWLGSRKFHFCFSRAGCAWYLFPWHHSLQWLSCGLNFETLKPKSPRSKPPIIAQTGARQLFRFLYFFSLLFFSPTADLELSFHFACRISQKKKKKRKLSCIVCKYKTSLPVSNSHTDTNQ